MPGPDATRLRRWAGVLSFRTISGKLIIGLVVLFGLASAELSDDAKQQLLPVAQALKDISAKIPPDLNWVLRVDGHTDTRQLTGNSQFRSNWELSAARAISVVQYLIAKGVAPQRLVAAGFGEFQPIDPGTTEDAFSRNRRIELKLTER